MRKVMTQSANRFFAVLLAAALLLGILPVVNVYAENEVVTMGCNDQLEENIKQVTLEAGQTITVEASNAAKYILSVSEDDVIITYKDKAYVSENGEVALFLYGSGQYIVFDITNTSSQKRTISLVFRRFEGHIKNPVILARIDDVTIQQLTMYEYGIDTGTYLQWTAPSDGTLVLDATNVESSFDGMKGHIYVNETQESIDGVLTRSVVKGETLDIRVAAFNAYNLPLDCLIYLKADFDGQQPAGGELDMISPVPENLTEGVDPEDIPEPTPTDPPASQPSNPPETQPSNPPVTEDPANPFTDVEEGRFYYDAVLWAVENGITTGVTATTFEPMTNCTRGQVVTFLWRSQGSPEPKSKVNPFTDTQESAYYYKAMLWAVEEGITNGISATQFAPNTECNRGQVATFLWRAVGSPKASSQVHPFTDISSTRFYYEAVLWAVEKGVTNGVSATAFGPDENCDRGQIVTFLHRAVA